VNDQSLFTQSEISEVRRRDATLTTRVTELIENLIVEKRLKPGDQLPSVRDLAVQFGVSRTVVREAVGALVARSLLDVRHGSGTTVRSPSTQSVVQSMSLLLSIGQPDIDYSKVHELRRVLEIEIAGLAAARRTAADLQTLARIVGEMEGIVGTGVLSDEQRENYIQNDLLFHSALAQATQNELFSVVLNSVINVMRQVRQKTLDVPGSHMHALNYHRAIFRQVEAADVTGARAAMQEHLIDSEALQRQAQALHDGTQ
jgi:GntR family transcriptional repressor for pyruvate dehydrogenase complex